MRVELKASGNFAIRSDNPLEAYALRMWLKENKDTGKVMIDAGFSVSSLSEKKMKLSKEQILYCEGMVAGI